MMLLSKCFGAALAIALLANTASAVDTVAYGKIKSIDAGAKTFVVTDAADKDFTYKLGDAAVVNRAGKEGKSDLKAGDTVNICYDKGTLTWTAHYILVLEDKTKNCMLVRVSIKSYDASKDELTFTNESKVDSTLPMGKATVRFNMEDAKIANVAIGDTALLIIETVDSKQTLKGVMVDRASK